MNEKVINNLRAKEAKYKEIQSKLDSIKKLILKTGEQPAFVDYSVEVVNKNILAVDIFGQRYFILFKNKLSSGEVTYTEIDNEGCTGKILESITLDKLGNLSKPHNFIPASDFIYVHYVVIDRIRSDAFQ